VVFAETWITATSLRHFDDKPNAFYIGNPITPVYAIDEKYYVFANALEDFC
jgi:hypothetical protein